MNRSDMMEINLIEWQQRTFRNHANFEIEKNVKNEIWLNIRNLYDSVFSPLGTQIEELERNQ